MSTCTNPPITLSNNATAQNKSSKPINRPTIFHPPPPNTVYLHYAWEIDLVSALVAAFKQIEMRFKQVQVGFQQVHLRFKQVRSTFKQIPPPFKQVSPPHSPPSTLAHLQKNQKRSPLRHWRGLLYLASSNHIDDKHDQGNNKQYVNNPAGYIKQEPE